jgi:hypothetical protein
MREVVSYEAKKLSSSPTTLCNTVREALPWLRMDGLLHDWKAAASV